MPEIIPLSLCIPTMHRPALLTKALDSIAASAMKPAETIVSDDSADDVTRELVERDYPWVRYVRGPRSGGIAGNRNAITQIVTQPHLAFMDDDAIVPDGFFEEIAEIIAETPDAVVTGRVRNHFTDGKIRVETPGGTNFLGFPIKPFDSGNSNMLTMSATVFPTSLFAKAQFDPHLIYGFDEVDIARRAASLGYPVLLRESFLVDHYPQQTNDWYRKHTNASRIYSTWNFYRRIQGQPVKAAVFASVATPHHLLVGALGRHGLGFAEARGDLRSAWRLARDSA